MLIFTDKTGQLGNQLFEFGTFISNCLTTNSKLINLHFDAYKDHFKGSENNYNKDLKLRVSYGNSKIDRCIRFFYGILSEIPWPKHEGRVRVLTSDEDSRSITEENFNKKIVFKKGAWFIDYPNFYKHKQDIKTYFSPLEVYQNNIDSLIKNCYREVDVLVGVHIRRGDYKHFMNGIFYFEDEIFYDKMQQIKELNKDKKVGFLICSNGKIDFNLFKGLNIYKANNHLIEDMYSLAECDYILGPPSTYTMWASFYGDRPLLKIRERHQTIKMEDFVVDYGY